MFERWAARHGSSHTRRAYRRDVLSFVEFLGLRWPQQAEELLRASVADVQRWRDAMREQQKAPKTRAIGIHFAAAEAIAEYIAKARLESGPLFRARRAPRADELGEQSMSEASMFRVVADYLARLPGAVKDGARIFSTHSLRATTATLLLDAGVDIRKVQELLGHRHVTTTQIYDKRRRTTKESASHDVPI